MITDLEKLALGHSPLTDRVYIGVPAKGGTWKYKHDVTNDFLACVISRWKGMKENISDGQNNYEITVKILK